jgi:hypothetical protein
MQTSADYKRRAEECRQHAAVATDPIERDALSRLAEQWQRLAEHKAKREAVKGA